MLFAIHHGSFFISIRRQGIYKYMLKDKNTALNRFILGTAAGVPNRPESEDICMSDTVYKEELFNALCNNSPTGVYIVQDGRFQFVNPQYRRMTGYSEEELLKMDSLMLVHTEDVGTVRGNAVKMLKGCRTEPYEFRFVRKNGEVRWVIETVTSIQFRGKRAALGNFMDVSECKWAEIALRESEGRYRTIFENTGTAMVIIKEDTTIFLINGKFEKILDYSMDEVEGKKSWTEFGMSPN